MEAAAQAGCSRIVYTSTVGCIGLPQPVNGQITPSDETTPVAEGQMSNHYKRSKWQAEQLAVKLARNGLPVVIVNPTAPVGPLDVKPTPTGRVIVDFLNRAMPAYLDTGLNWVHVRDVAAGHVLAAEHGNVGERYILGNADGNWTMQEAFAALDEHHRHSRAAPANSLLGGAPGRARERGAGLRHGPAAESSAGRGAHGEIQNVLRSRQSHSRTGPAPNAAGTGAG